VLIFDVAQKFTDRRYAIVSFVEVTDVVSNLISFGNIKEFQYG
jgi:hypothetical protein